MPARVILTGFNEFIQRLENEANDLVPKVDDELQLTVSEAEEMAKFRAPIGRSGALGASIGSTKIGQLNYEIFAAINYAPYVEFGTGVNVFKGLYNFRPDLRDYAKEFFVSGKGTQFPSPFFFISIDTAFGEFVNKIKTKVFDL